MVTRTPYDAKGHGVAVEASTPDQLFLDGNGQPVFQTHIVSAGQVLEPLSVMGMVTATSQLVLCDNTQGDGSEVPYAILFEELDTSATGLNADTSVRVVVFSTQMFNFNALRYHSSWQPRDIQIALTKIGIASSTAIYSDL